MWEIFHGPVKFTVHRQDVVTENVAQSLSSQTKVHSGKFERTLPTLARLEGSAVSDSDDLAPTAFVIFIIV